VNDRTPVADITAAGDGGSPQPRNRYGAAGETATGAADADGRTVRQQAAATMPASNDLMTISPNWWNRTGSSVV
jgi:hypothetical protein